MGSEDFACAIALIAVHVHADSEHSITAFLDDTSQGVEKVIMDAAKVHGVTVVEVTAGDPGDDEEDSQGG